MSGVALLDKQANVDLMFAGHFVAVLIWLSFSLVAGFAIYEVVPLTPSAPVNAVSHLGWWIILEVATCIMLGRVTGHRIIAAAKTNKLQLSASRQETGVIFAEFMLVISWISNCVHFGLAINEACTGVSVLHRDRFWFLVGFIVLLGLIIAYKILFLYVLVQFSRAIKAALLELPSNTFDLEVGGGSATAASSSSSIGTRVHTPAMRAALKGK
jgi:hypothetical protein